MPLEIVQTEEGATGWAAIQQANLANIKAFVDALETDVDEFPNELKNLTAAEIQQLENIGANTISAAQWAWLGLDDQGVAQTDDVLFNDLDLTAPSDFWSMTDGRYYTKTEILDLISGAAFDFWLSDTADGVIGAYNRMFDADTGEIKSSIGPITIDADPKLIKAFITSTDFPDFTTLSEGVYQLNIHALTTVGANVKAAQLHWKLYRRTQPGGVETLLITSETSDDLTAGEIHYEIHGLLTEEETLDATDRLVLKIYGTRTGVQPQNPDVTISMEGDTASRIAIRTTLSAFDERYLRLNGASPMKNDLNLGTFAITNVGNVDGVDVSALKTDVDGFPDELKNLTQVEIQQLENIGATTLSAAQWGFLGAQTGRVGMTNRGDPAAFDFVVGALITDGTWRELDLSGIVPAGAKTVALRVNVQDNLPNKRLNLASLDVVNYFVAATIRTQVANIGVTQIVILPVDANRKLQYEASNTVWSAINIVVTGWWFE